MLEVGPLILTLTSVVVVLLVTWGSIRVVVWWQEGRHIRRGPQTPEEETVIGMIGRGEEPKDELKMSYGVYCDWRNADVGRRERIRHAHDGRMVHLKRERVRKAFDRYYDRQIEDHE